MDKVLDLLSQRKWQKHCLRTNAAQPEDIRIMGSVKVAKIYSNVLNKREKSLNCTTRSRRLPQSGGATKHRSC